MPVCQNCGGHVSEDAVRVLYPSDVDIEICPGCPGVPNHGLKDYIDEHYGSGQVTRTKMR